MAKPKTPRMTRAIHEEFAIEALDAAKRDLTSAHSCDSGSLYALTRANRDIARARVHVATISYGGEGKRTRHLWGAVGKVEKRVMEANNRLAKCLLRG